MSFELDGLHFDIPKGFGVDEGMMSFSLRTGPDDGKRPNIVYHRKRNPEKQDLQTLVTMIEAQLQLQLPGFTLTAKEEVEFKDGCKGMLMHYRFVAGEQGEIQQMQSIRIDGDIVTMVTLTATADGLDESGPSAGIRCERPAKPHPANAQPNRGALTCNAPSQTAVRQPRPLLQHRWLLASPLATNRHASPLAILGSTGG